MRIVRATLVALAFVSLSLAAGAMDEDLATIQAKIAAQEARISDLQAKMSYADCAEDSAGLVSIRKNAVVTVGGLVTTKYTHTDGRINSRYDYDEPSDSYVRTNDYRRRAKMRYGSLEMTDTEVYLQIDVNDHFEAFVNMDLSNQESDYATAKAYYVRWKNICDTGFGLKVGRDALVFGDDGVGELASYAAGSGDGIGEYDEFANWQGLYGAGGEGAGIPMHNGWDVDGVTQITPYWEGLDGKLSFELSFMQSIYDDTPYMHSRQEGAMYIRDSAGGVRKYRTRNYGVGTMSARAVIAPIEGLKFTLSAANYRSNGDPETTDCSRDFAHSKNNSVYGLAASYRPCYFDRLFVWGQWVHGQNVGFHKDMDSDAVNFGASFDLVDNLTFFAQGDYLRTKYKFQGANEKGTAWAFYTGLSYSLPYGVTLEAGWKHERVKFKSHSLTEAKIRADTIYAMASFEF